jgi:alpha-L-fucosidase
MHELTYGDYGKLGMLLFDLCDVSPKGKKVDWPRFAQMIRIDQPGIMMVARGSNDQIPLKPQFFMTAC